MKMLRKAIIVTSLLLICGGCISQSSDGKWHVSLSPQVAETIEGVAEVSTSILALLSPLIPGLAAAAGLAGGVTATYKKMKPGLVKNKAVSQHVVSSIETLKKAQPELWAKVKVYLQDHSNTDIDQYTKEIIKLTKQMEAQNG